MPHFGNLGPEGGTDPIGGTNTSGAMKEVVVTLSDAALQDLGAVTQRLQAKGLLVEQSFPPVGTIVGKAAPGTIAILESDPDVVTVNVSRNFDTAGG